MKTLLLLFLSLSLPAQVLNPLGFVPSDLFGYTILQQAGNPTAAVPFHFIWTVAPWHSYYYPQTSVTLGGTVGFACEAQGWYYLGGTTFPCVHTIAPDGVPSIVQLPAGTAGPGYDLVTIFPGQVTVGPSFSALGSLGNRRYWNELTIPNDWALLGTSYASQWVRLDVFDGLFYASDTKGFSINW